MYLAYRYVLQMTYTMQNEMIIRFSKEKQESKYEERIGIQYMVDVCVVIIIWLFHLFRFLMM